MKCNEIIDDELCDEIDASYDGSNLREFRRWCYHDVMPSSFKIVVILSIVISIVLGIISMLMKPYNYIFMIVLLCLSVIVINVLLLKFIQQYVSLIISDDLNSFFTEIICNRLNYCVEEFETIDVGSCSLSDYHISDHYDEILPKYESLCRNVYGNIGGKSQMGYSTYLNKILSYKGISEQLDKLVDKHLQPCDMHIYVTVKSNLDTRRFIIGKDDIVSYFKLDKKFIEFKLVNSLR